MRRPTLLGSILALLAAGAPAWSQGSLGSNTTHIFLVKDCTDAGWAAGDVGTKCVESVSDLNNRIWGTGGIFPTALAPLTVDIGPGEFTGTINCPQNEGYVTFRGAGRDRTVIKGQSTGALVSAVLADNCTALGFQDMAFTALNTGTGVGYAIEWIRGGGSSWTDVDISGDIAGWYDSYCEGQPGDPSEGEHYFWGSKVSGGKFGYLSVCGQSWFYGGEISAMASLKGGFTNKMTGVWVSHQARFQMFGSAIRVSTAGFTSGSGDAYGVRVGPSFVGSGGGWGEFHSHGGVISVDSSSISGVAATGLLLFDNGVGNAKSHTLDTAFSVKGGSTSTRLAGTGTFESPHLWEARTSPPTAGGGIDGQDIYVETDCNSSGCSGGSDPHLMIYKSGCTSSPWFDTVRNACRN